MTPKSLHLTPATASDPRPVRRSLAGSVGAITRMVVFALPLPGWLVHGSSLISEVSREFAFWALTLVLVAYVLLVERRSVSPSDLIRQHGRSLLRDFGNPCDGWRDGFDLPDHLSGPGTLPYRTRNSRNESTALWVSRADHRGQPSSERHFFADLGSNA